MKGRGEAGRWMYRWSDRRAQNLQTRTRTEIGFKTSLLLSKLEVNMCIYISGNILLISLVLILAELGLIVVGLVHPAWSKDGHREVVLPNDFQRLKATRTRSWVRVSKG